MHATRSLVSLTLTAAFYLTSPGWTIELPSFSVQKAQAVCQLIRERSREYFQSSSMAVRYDLIAYYLRRLQKKPDSFELPDVLSFVLTTRSLTVRANPPQPVLDAWRELDLCFQEIATANRLEYSILPEAAYFTTPPVPSDLETRREELSFALHHLRGSVAQLQRTLGQGQTNAELRIQSDLFILSQAVEDMDRGLRLGQLSDAHFAVLQTARARWEVSRSLLPLLSFPAGAEISELTQTCCELWRAGR